jgi:hypothetical protein
MKLFYAAVNSSALKRSSFVTACTDDFDTPVSWVNRLEYYSLNASNRAPVTLNVFIENAAFDVTVLFPRRKLYFEFFQQSEYC